MVDRMVTQSFNEPYMVFQCDCGWRGYDRDIREWAIRPKRDRIIRQCPSCCKPIPEWGMLGPIDGVAQIAQQSLKAAIEEQSNLYRES